MTFSHPLLLHFFSHFFPSWKQHWSGEGTGSSPHVLGAPHGGRSAAQRLDAVPALRTLPAGKMGITAFRRWVFLTAVSRPPAVATWPRVGAWLRTLSGVECHPYSPCAARQKPSTPPRHSGSTKNPPLTVPDSPHCRVRIGPRNRDGKRRESDLDQGADRRGLRPKLKVVFRPESRLELAARFGRSPGWSRRCIPPSS